jgi:hypothetical protein
VIQVHPAMVTHGTGHERAGALLGVSARVVKAALS